MPTIKHIITHSLLLLLILTGAQRAYPATPEELRAAYLFNFTKHTQWPNEAELTAITIGFYPDQPNIRRVLEQAEQDKTVRALPLITKAFNSVKDAREAQILLLAPSMNGDLQRISSQLDGSQTLQVTDQADDQLHTMINFITPSADKLSFEVHRPNIIFEGLTIDNQILLIGGTELDVAKIYKQTQQALSEIKNTLRSEELRLNKQTELLTQQAQLLSERDANLKSKADTLKTLQVDLARTQKQLINDQTAAELNRKQIQQQQLQIEEQKAQLAARDQEVQKKEENIEQNSQLINQQLGIINSQKDLITKQTKTLDAQHSTIEKQQNTLFYQQWGLLSLVIIVVITLYGIYQYVKSSRKLAVANQQLQKTSAELQQASEAKSLFLSTMSHEIRTPLNGVLGMTDLLRNTSLDQQQKRHLGVIESSGQLLLNVINDILDYSKIEAGKMVLENIPFNINRMIHDCATSFSHQAYERKLQFHLLIDPNLPKRVFGDPSRLTQVLTNFLSNAFKFTENGEIQVIAERSDDSNTWKLCVRDTGKGMTPEQSEKVFEAFTQADTSITRNHGGTGLGLSICQKLIELMQGEVHLTSELGKGSSFWVELPLRSPDISSPDSHNPDTQQTTDSPLTDNNVIVADSCTAFRNNICDHLEAWGATAIPVRNAFELRATLEANQQENTTLVLSDNLLDINRDECKQLDEHTALIYVCADPKVHSVNHPRINLSALLHQPLTPSELFNTLAENHNLQQHVIDEPKEERPNFQHARILVAEDNQVNQMVVRGLLKQYGITPCMVENGQQALDQLTQEEFDLVLMDCEMPVLDGYEASRLWREKEEAESRNNTIAIVALTAHAMQEHRDKAQAFGMTDHLAKPLQREELERILTQYC